MYLDSVISLTSGKLSVRRIAPILPIVGDDLVARNGAQSKTHSRERVLAEWKENGTHCEDELVCINA